MVIGSVFFLKKLTWWWTYLPLRSKLIRKLRKRVILPMVLKLGFPKACPPSDCSMIKILYWNCKGICNTPIKPILFHLISIHFPDLIFLPEPKVSSDSPNPIGLQSLGFTSLFSNTNSTLWCIGKPSANLSLSFRSLLSAYHHHYQRLFSFLILPYNRSVWHYKLYDEEISLGLSSQYFSYNITLVCGWEVQSFGII